MKAADIRRQQLRQWINLHYQGKPARFASAVKRPQPQIADVLDGRKAFGEKLARALEVEAGMPDRYLDGLPAAGSSSHLLIFGTPVTRAGVMLGSAWDALDVEERIKFEQEIYAAAAKKNREPSQQRPEISSRPDKE